MSLNPEARERLIDHINRTPDGDDVTVILITIEGDSSSIQHVVGVNGMRLLHASRGLLEQTVDVIEEDLDKAIRAGDAAAVVTINEYFHQATEALELLPRPLDDGDDDEAKAWGPLDMPEPDENAVAVTSTTDALIAMRDLIDGIWQRYPVETRMRNPAYRAMVETLAAKAEGADHTREHRLGENGKKY